MTKSSQSRILRRLLPKGSQVGTFAQHQEDNTLKPYQNLLTSKKPQLTNKERKLLMAYTKHLSPTAKAYRQDPFEVISMMDDAIDWSRSDRDKYAETRKVEYLQFNEQVPVRFYLKLLPPDLFLAATSQFSYVDANGKTQIRNPLLLAQETFRYTVTKIEGLLDNNGNPLGTVQPTHVHHNGDGTTSIIWDRATVNNLFAYQLQLVGEIGMVSYERHFLASGIVDKFSC